MNPTEIADALETICGKPYDPAEFGYWFAEAIGCAAAAIQRLRGGRTNRSDVQGGLLVAGKFHFAPAEPGMVHETIEILKRSRSNVKGKPAILISSDGETVEAYHPKSEDVLHCAHKQLGDNYFFILPAAGMDRFEVRPENKVDVKASRLLAKLYDAILRVNPDWKTAERRHDLNIFMTRLIFCMFAEDVGIFPERQFSNAVFSHGGNKGEHARETIIAAFEAMNLPKSDRKGLPAWATAFEYVNGGLFLARVDSPRFDPMSFRYLRDACEMDWRLINPDIFGSMIQSIADPERRAELGMHYTSVPNIMKVLGPLFLTELDDFIEKGWDKANGLKAILQRISNYRIFDPACGSGNFLVVSYRELREREITILRRLGEIETNPQNLMWSNISLNNFFGIELTDFAAETAKLALFIAEYQANARFKDVFGRMPALLPLRDGGNITTDNSLRCNWSTICPPLAGEGQVYIVGNPPFKGKAKQDAAQKADMDHVFLGQSRTYRALDYVTPWFYKAAKYISDHGGEAALVATSSVCQGASVPVLWPLIASRGVSIKFAHRPFKWRNNATANAAVSCVIVGLSGLSTIKRYIFDGDLRTEAKHINGYLIDSALNAVDSTRRPINGLPEMSFGNMAYDDGGLILTPGERQEFIAADGRSERFIRRYMGSQEVVKGIERYCLWIHDSDLAEAASIPKIAERLDLTRSNRLQMDDQAGRDLASRPHSFREQNEATQHSILVPRVTSEGRPYLPVDLVGADVIPNDNTQVLYDAPEWCVALIASHLHRVWILAVCGQLESRIRYSKDLGWNTFPVPRFTEAQKQQLHNSARDILRVRYGHFPHTIAQLYDPEDMPDDLRRVHATNDQIVETMYVGRGFRTDTERLDHLFKLYAANIARRAASR